jgi:Ca2+-binding RTX toxin-like protein
VFRRWVFASMGSVTFAALIGGFAPARAVADDAGEVGVASSGVSPILRQDDVATSVDECPVSGGWRLGTQTFTTAESEFYDRTPNQGWYGKFVYGDPVENFDNNANYLVGDESQSYDGDLVEYRDFFTFDLSRLSSHVVCARLEIFSRELNGQATEELGLFNVSTPAERLNERGRPSLAIFDDLGTGENYGHHSVDTTRDNEWLTLPLNGTAVQQLNEATGFFSIGGRLLTLDRRPGSGAQNLFWYSGDRDVRLVVETDEPPLCFGLPATIVGTDGDDNLFGTDGPDVIASLAGNDVVHPGDGDDLTCAGPGDDDVKDRRGNDKIRGEDGSDSLGGGFGNDRLSGGPGDDIFVDNEAAGDRGNDGMFGGAGNDIFTRDSGDDVGYGGSGADRWASGMGGGSQTFYGGPDNDRADINIEARDFPENPAPYAVHVWGGLGDDRINVFNFIPVATKLFGGPGADSISDADSNGRDLLRGGPGDDALRVDFTDLSIPTGGLDYRLRGGRGADLLIGSARRDLLRGGPGHDTIEGRAGNDVIRGRGGADTLHGNRGADTLRGGPGRDANFGGPGTDLCRSPSRGPLAHSCER